MSTTPPSSPSASAHPGPAVVHLRAAGVSLLLEVADGRLPRIAHWGADLGVLGPADEADVLRAARPPVVSNSLDEPVPVGVVPEPSHGWPGIPGIEGHRDGRDFTARFVVESVDVREEAGGVVAVRAVDPDVRLGLDLEVELTPEGLVRLRATLENLGGDTYTLDALRLALPLPTTAQEVLDFTGRHLRERAPQRHDLTLGSHVRTGRRGRTGADATLLLVAGARGFGFATGEVWGVHTAWSGNHTTYVERDSAGAGVLGGGEELLPGEVRLRAGESYTTPLLIGSYGEGLDALSARFHDHLRARRQHRTGPRLVALNTWEAVYFDHDLPRLLDLAERAAALGVERFILDDGWFRGRRDDSAGLGDWYVDDAVWPDGLTPLVTRVRELGMQFGLWFEPEMINVDSDAARTHPEWVMSPGTRLPPDARHQQVLDLANPEAFEHVLGRIDAVVTENHVDYIKWDHNRDLVDAGHPGSGRAGVHDQTLTVYRLIDELRRRHPELEIESCSSGGARADLGILERTERIWASDCIDALERQVNQRWTGLLLPPEMIGSHVGAPRAHTTGRTHGLDLRAGTALFGHFGIEWDLSVASPAELEEMRAWIDLYKVLRPLLHGGRVVRVDHPDPAHWLHGVVARDGREAVFALVSMATSAWAPPGSIRFAGLRDDVRYRVRLLDPVERRPAHGLPSRPAWTDDGVVLPGAALRSAGVQAPAIPPETLQLFHLTSVG